MSNRPVIIGGIVRLSHFIFGNIQRDSRGLGKGFAGMESERTYPRLPLTNSPTPNLIYEGAKLGIEFLCNIRRICLIPFPYKTSATIVFTASFLQVLAEDWGI